MGAAPSLQLRHVCTLQGHEERIWCVAWRPMADPPQLATCGADRSIRFWVRRKAAAAREDCHWSLAAEVDATEQHGRTLRSLSWNPSGDLLAVASFDATVSLWKDVEGPETETTRMRVECVGVVTGHENEVKAAAFSPSGEYLATCSRDKSVWIYEASSSNASTLHSPGLEFECVAILQSHTQDVKNVKWHPEQDILFTCSYDDTIKVWGPDGDDWACKETLVGHDSTVWCMSFDAVGARFVSCSEDRTLRIWAPANDSFATAPMPLAARAFISPLFQRSIAGLDRLLSLRTKAQPPADAACPWRCVAAIKNEHPRPIYSVDVLSFDVDWGAMVVASACGDNHVRVFTCSDTRGAGAWKCVADVEAHFGDANAVAWCQAPPQEGGALLASVGDDADVKIWQLG